MTAMSSAVVAELPADPYRWLEDPHSEQTVAWIAEQRERCDQELDGYSHRDEFASVMDEVLRRPRWGTPVRQGEWWFRTLNPGDLDQDQLYGARSLEELLAGGHLVLDPNQWSQDGTTSLTTFVASPDGRWLAYGRSEAGSDWTRLEVLDLDSGALTTDRLLTKFTRPAWLPDSSGFTYLDFPDSGQAQGTETQTLAGGVLMVHRLGEDASGDQDLLRFDDDPQLMVHAEVHESATGDWLVAAIGAGTAPEQMVWVARLLAGPERVEVGEWHRLCPEADHPRFPIGVHDDRLLLLTTQDAALGTVVALGLPGTEVEGQVTVVVPEGEWALEDLAMASTGLVAHRLVAGESRVELRGLDGALRSHLDLNGEVLVSLASHPASSEVFLGTSSLTSPRTSWRLDTSNGDLGRLDDPGRGSTLPVVTTRHTATSADGTHVPYFVTRPVGVEGPQPTLMYGYGGFGIPVQTDYRAGWEGWLRAGGTLVITQLRGGSEFGEPWHQQGIGAKKQNVFNDFIAIAEQLVADGLTTSDQLASYGRSNGGLLVGATMTQRPDLFAAAIPQVGVLDMLRFHLFTIGRAWIPDYGDPDDADQLQHLLAYSPVHRVREGVSYPAALVVTGDHDDRVVPAHSFKFTAALQQAQQQGAPVIARIEQSTGHGAGKPARLQALEWADILTFAAHHTGLEPAWHGAARP